MKTETDRCLYYVQHNMTKRFVKQPLDEKEPVTEQTVTSCMSVAYNFFMWSKQVQPSLNLANIGSYSISPSKKNILFRNIMNLLSVIDEFTPTSLPFHIKSDELSIFFN